MLTVKLSCHGIPKLHSADDNSVIWLRDETMEALIYNNHRRVALLLHKLKPGCTDQLPGDQQTCTNSVFLQPAGCNALVLIEHYVTLSLPQQ